MEVWRKYGVETTIVFTVLKVGDTDFAATGDWTPATGDIKISKNGAAVVNTSNLVVAVSGAGSVLWKLTLTATEMQAAVIAIQIVDAAIENQLLLLNTYGHASAMHAWDLDSATPTVNVTQIEGSDPTDQINAAVDAAIADARLDELVSATAGAVKPVVGSIMDLIMNKSGSQTFDPATDSLEAISDGGTVGPTAGAVADAVWDELFADHAGAGSFGRRLDDIPDSVWEENHVDHMVPGTFGAHLDMPISVVPGAEKQRRGD